MSRRLAGTLLPVILLCAGCGSSQRETETTAPSPAASSSRSAGPASGSDTSTRSSSVPASPAAPGATGSRARGTRGTPTGGATHVRLPARFVIRAGGRLDPPSVSSPADLAIELTVFSGDRLAHRVVLRTPAVHALAVAAGKRSSALIPGLRPGRYVIAIDGAPRGALLVGGGPGP
ncbi:MAG: hypothetical protein ACR2IP_12635 [Solirubrobacteraceae bacterium]